VSIVAGGWYISNAASCISAYDLGAVEACPRIASVRLASAVACVLACRACRTCSAACLQACSTRTGSRERCIIIIGRHQVPASVHHSVQSGSLLRMLHCTCCPVLPQPPSAGQVCEEDLWPVSLRPLLHTRPHQAPVCQLSDQHCHAVPATALPPVAAGQAGWLVRSNSLRQSTGAKEICGGRENEAEKVGEQHPRPALAANEPRKPGLARPAGGP